MDIMIALQLLEPRPPFDISINLAVNLVRSNVEIHSRRAIHNNSRVEEVWEEGAA